MAMRVAHVSATFPPYPGGTGNVCLENCRELVRRGVDVHVITAGAPGLADREQLDGISVHRLPVWLRYGNAPAIPGLFRALRDFDLIHLHYPFIGGELAAISAYWNRIPLVVTYHQDVLLDGPMRHLERGLRETAGRFTLRSAKRVLFTTADYAKQSHVFPMLEDVQDRVGVLPNGVDVDTFIPAESRPEVRRRLNIPTEQSVAVLVARLDRAHYFKGVDHFLQALCGLDDTVLGVIVGDGDLRSHYQDTARALGIAHRVRFTGKVTNEDLPRWYQAADVTVLPSTTMGEAFGLVLVESMACGTPVIASRLPGVREVVRDNETGRLVKPGEIDELRTALQHMIDNKTYREQLGAAGRSYVERQFSWRSIGDKLESLYDSLVPRRALEPAPLPASERR